MTYEAFGESKSLLAWSKDPRCKVSRTALRSRLKGGMGLESALTKTPSWTPGESYEAFGESKSLAQWARDPRCVVPYARLQNRVVADGMEIEKALTSEVGSVVPGRRYEAEGQSLSLSAWSERLGISPSALHSRIHRMGWPVAEAVSTEPLGGSSRLERQMAQFVQSIIPNAQTNVGGLIPRQELDIFCPDQQVAFEFNGLYWHSEAHKSRTYHYDKWRACQEVGITLFQVWEDDWTHRKVVVEAMIAHKLGRSAPPSVFARCTEVDLAVPSGEAAEFLDLHHIQGAARASVRVGLRCNGVLVALGCFSRSNDVPWDLVRFATSVPVPGGFSRVLKAFRADHPGPIKTFADLCVSDGGLYERNGFVKDRMLPPDYSYLVGTKRVHKFNFRKARFQSDPGLVFRPGLTERELARLNGLWRIWDAGKIRYILPASSSPDRVVAW